MLPAQSLPLDIERRRVIPRYLTEADHIWLGVLLDECERYVGRRRIELEQRLKEPLGVRAPAEKLRVAVRVVLREYTDRTDSPVSPVTIRQELFAARAREDTREAAQASASRQLGIPPEEVVEYLFADLPSERRLAPLKHPLSSTELALRTNHAIVSSLLKKATMVRIYAEGDVRSLVSAVKLRGLLCTALPRDGGRSAQLEVSGPYALFRHTIVYGRALASLLSRAARCTRFGLHATCAIGSEGELVEFEVRSGDPVLPAAKGKTYDSKVEERFARDFSKIALDWELVREPEAVDVGNSWIFPDFLLRHRRHPERAVLMEIVGFWTPEYLQRKLSALRRANVGRIILCVDAARNCANEELPADACIVRYQRSVPAVEVLRILEQQLPAAPTRPV